MRCTCSLQNLTWTPDGFKELITCTHSCPHPAHLLSCSCSCPQVHVECPRLRMGLNHSWGRVSSLVFLLSPLPLSLPQSSTSDKLTLKPCFIPALQAVDDTSFRQRNMQWVTLHCWRTEEVSIYMISHPEAEMGLWWEREIRMVIHKKAQNILILYTFSTALVFILLNL